MYEPKSFFDEMMNYFSFMTFLRFTFQSSHNCTKLGAEFLSKFFWNLFIAEPQQAKIDDAEINFGF